MDSRITFDRRSGAPQIRELGYFVSSILSNLNIGTSEADVLRSFPGLELEDLEAARRYVAEQRLIDLASYKGIGLILLTPSGVRYSNQTGGHANDHPQAEGVFVPLADDFGVVLGWLREHFTGPKWRGACYAGIDEETADFLEEKIGEYWAVGPISVDRTRLADSEEAWIYVTMGDAVQLWKEVRFGPPEPDLYGFTGAPAILTWANSD